MREELTREDITQELVDAVAAYIQAKAQATVMREAVDEVAREVLDEVELMNYRTGEPITNPDRTYLAEEGPLYDYFARMDARLRDAGLKPDDMGRDYCPALVAEDAQHKAEVAVITEAAKMLEMDKPERVNNRLLCQENGLDARQEFIDITASLVVSAGFIQ